MAFILHFILSFRAQPLYVHVCYWGYVHTLTLYLRWVCVYRLFIPPCFFAFPMQSARLVSVLFCYMLCLLFCLLYLALKLNQYMHVCYWGYVHSLTYHISKMSLGIYIYYVIIHVCALWCSCWSFPRISELREWQFS